MTLNGIYSKEETKKHALLKFMCLIACVKQGHKADVEFNAGKGIGIFDCVDWTTGLVYEPIGSKSKKVWNSKRRKYLRYAGIRDVIFIDTNDFNEFEPVATWFTKLDEIIG